MDYLAKGIIEVVQRHGMHECLHKACHTIHREVRAAQEHHRKANQQRNRLRCLRLLDVANSKTPLILSLNSSNYKRENRLRHQHPFGDEPK